MKKSIFKLIVKINKAVLPTYSNQDPMKLSKLQKGILAFKYWALTNSLN